MTWDGRETSGEELLWREVGGVVNDPDFWGENFSVFSEGVLDDAAKPCGSSGRENSMGLASPLACRVAPSRGSGTLYDTFGDSNAWAIGREFASAVA
jgi:hypothetical protein